jgi:AcrR family transcriptional regulator
MPATSDNNGDVAAQILAEATVLFAAQGYDGTSLKAIAERVGIRKPSLLYHYPSKEELRMAVLRGVFARWNDVLPTILQAATTGTDRFEGLVTEVVSFFTDEPDRARLLLREMLDRPELLRAQMSQFVAPWIAIVTDYIRTGQREGTVRSDVDPEAYVLHVIQMVVGGVATSSVLGAPDEKGKPGDVERQVRETIRIARAALFVESDPEQTQGVTDG